MCPCGRIAGPPIRCAHFRRAHVRRTFTRVVRTTRRMRDGSSRAALMGDPCDFLWPPHIPLPSAFCRCIRNPNPKAGAAPHSRNCTPSLIAGGESVLFHGGRATRLLSLFLAIQFNVPPTSILIMTIYARKMRFIDSVRKCLNNSKIHVQYLTFAFM